jgi:hypothetical protein
VPGKQRADHDHGGAKADALGNVAVAADAAVGNDGLGGHAGAPLERAELPAAGAKAGLEFGDADLARAHAHLGGVGAPVLQVDHRFGRGHIAGDHKGTWAFFPQVADHVLHAVGMAMGDVDGDVLWRQAQVHQRSTVA